MSNVEAGVLSQYNSLTDDHLAGYFSNSRKRRHLIRSGLITRNGELVPEPVYRLRMARKEHKTHVRDMLAQAIVHKSLDMERERQVKIRKKLEEIAKMEQVRRIKNARMRRGDEDVLPLLDPSAGKIHRRKQKPNKLGDDEDQKSDDDCDDLESNGMPPHPDTVHRRRLRKLMPKESIDGKHLYPLDSVALSEYARILETLKSAERGRSAGYLSPYSVPQHSNRSPPNRSPRRVSSRPKSAAVRSKKTKEDNSKFKGNLMLHRTEPAVKFQSSLHSLCTITLHYHGKQLMTALGPELSEEISIEQQHSGGNTLPVFKDYLKPGDNFNFVSRRHRGYPFALTIYINGIMDSRVSSCCEYKHKKGARLGSKNGHFSVASVEGAAPCFRCQVEQDMMKDKKGKRKPKKKNDSVFDADYADDDFDEASTSSHDESKSAQQSLPSERNDDKSTQPSDSDDDQRRKVTTSYTVETVTGTKLGSGTDSNVHVMLLGSDGNSGKLTLKHGNDNLFESGVTDRFEVEAGNVGKVSSVKLGHDGSGFHADWYVDHISITDNNSGIKYICNVDKWVSKDRDISLIPIVVRPEEQQQQTKQVPVVKEEPKIKPQEKKKDEKSSPVKKEPEKSESPIVHRRRSSSSSSGGSSDGYSDKKARVSPLTSPVRSLSSGSGSPSRRRETYRLRIYTKEKIGDNDKTTPYFILEGNARSSGRQSLQNDSHYNFGNDQWDDFEIKMKDVGDVRVMKLGQENVGFGSKWIVPEVELIAVEACKKWRFKFSTAGIFGETQGIATADKVYDYVAEDTRRQPPVVERDTAVIDFDDDSDDEEVAKEEVITVQVYDNKLEDSDTDHSTSRSIPKTVSVPVAVEDTEDAPVTEGRSGLLEYKVTFFTGADSSAGTRANVNINISGQLRESKQKNFNNDGTRFGSSSQTSVQVFSPDLGDIQAVRVWTDSDRYSDNWFLDKIEIVDISKNKTYVFPCNYWLTEEFSSRMLVVKDSPASSARTSSDNFVPESEPEPIVQQKEQISPQRTTEDVSSRRPVGGMAPSSTDEESESDTDSDSEYTSSDPDESEESTPRDLPDEKRMRSGSIQTLDMKPPEERLGKVDHLFTDNSFSVFDTIFNQKQIEDVIRKLHSLPANQIESFTVRNCALDDNNAIKLLDALSNMKKVKYLNLNCNKLTSMTAAILGRRLSDWTELETLLLHSNPIGDDGVFSIVTSLRKATGQRLQSLDLGDTHITNTGMQQIAQLLEENPSISSLELTGTKNINEQSWSLLGRSLAHNTHVESLSLDYCGLSDSELDSFIYGLDNNQHLQVLDLEGNTNLQALDGLYKCLKDSKTKISIIELDHLPQVSQSRIEAIQSILSETGQ